MKAGQKCTAIRRTFVPDAWSTTSIGALKKRLAGVKVGDPSIEGVRMGPLAGRGQVREVQKSAERLRAPTELRVRRTRHARRRRRGSGAGRFFPATLFYLERSVRRAREPHDSRRSVRSTRSCRTHVDEAIELARKGKGSLVGSLFTARRRRGARGRARHGRLSRAADAREPAQREGIDRTWLTAAASRARWPGRAGGGEEMGGVRGVMHYMQRTALQGRPRRSCT